MTLISVLLDHFIPHSKIQNMNEVFNKLQKKKNNGHTVSTTL
jgi:hypothetical protein